MKNILFVFVAIWVLAAPQAGYSLMPDEIAVVANSRALSSVSLAQYYIKKRSIPTDNLIVLSSIWKERCSRKQYNEEIKDPLLEKLTQLKNIKKIKCLVMMYGLPLKIKSTGLTAEQQQVYETLQKEKKKISSLLKKNIDDITIDENKNRLNRVKQQLNILQMKNDRGAVDSELSLLFSTDHQIAGWLPNPYFVGHQGKELNISKNDVLLVSRLDGPNPQTVRRMIDETIEVEAIGLRGLAYFDARWSRPESNKLNGYALYDASLHDAAKMLSKNGFSVVLDEKGELFQAGTAPDAALYCGWYSLANYVDAFTWQKGAVGYHIASAECSTLKRRGSNVWCKKMLEDGVVATVGPVYEPYVQGLPLPHIFFAALTDGRLSLAEVFMVSQPYLSWQTILVGDPLYRPYAIMKHKKKPETSVRTSPALSN